MRWQGRRESDNVEDRRGQSGSPFGGGGGGGFRLPSGKGGIVLLIIVLVAGYYGVDLTGMLTGEPMPQQQSQGRVVPDSFTHGTSKQRYTWFKRGFDSGDPAQCNTFGSAL